jgi:deoxyribodipyrimidine photo-lyase
MQQSQRAEDNPALEYAIRRANGLELPVVVVFGLAPDYPEANLRHYIFMLQGLRDVSRKLARRRILFVVQHGDPPEVALKLGHKASMIICDRGYLRHQRQWRSEIAHASNCLVEEVECDAIVPVEVASNKRESSARSFRPKVLRLRHLFLDKQTTAKPKVSASGLSMDCLNLEDEDSVLGIPTLDISVKPVLFLKGGTHAAKSRLSRFIRSRLTGYSENRNQPGLDYLSYMSAYLHFGQISPAYIVRKILDSGKGTQKDRDSYLDELIVRRELAINFVYYAGDYDQFDSLPEWAQTTLQQHRGDERKKIYTLKELEDAKTQDPYWNAAMNEMKSTGYMHNYMRMYWGKQILAWSLTPEIAFKTVLELNNKYFIDGRDPSSYANVGWIFGLHDRPWPRREIFGSVRSMTIGGLKRKANPDDYVKKVERLIQSQR